MKTDEEEINKWHILVITSYAKVNLITLFLQKIKQKLLALKNENSKHMILMKRMK